MFPRLRRALLGILFATAQLVCESSSGESGWAFAAASRAAAQAGTPQGHAPAAADHDKVYRYKGQGGRDVFTNAANVTVAGAAPRALELPKLLELDLSGVSPAQLQVIDRSVQQAHEQQQTGRRCEAIRASMRVPLSGFIWPERVREVCIGAALLALALVVMLAWQGRLKRLMPLPPMLACIYLAYFTYERIEHRRGALLDGLRACSSDLPPAKAGNPDAIKDRLASASSLQEKIDRAYAQRAEMVESIMRQR
ncbi:MAG: hypothetical protein JWN48_2523 [Myxococcaceae bacterium]|nr:hypothetical protein [Myxococcaceae bacterium]